MTKIEFMTAVAAIVSTLAETNGGPESMIYMAMGSDLSKWHAVRDAMLRVKLITVDANFVKLTDAGRKLASQVDCERATR